MTPDQRKLEKIEAQMSEMRKHSYEVERKVDEVISLLKGDDFGNLGVVQQVKSNKDRIKKLEVLKDRATWTVLGLSIPSGYGVWEIVRKIFT